MASAWPTSIKCTARVEDTACCISGDSVICMSMASGVVLGTGVMIDRLYSSRASVVIGVGAVVATLCSSQLTYSDLETSAILVG